MHDTTDTRAQILESADRRFRQYGLGKTTMAEIASDCDMSAANLYRYFTNKQEIVLAIAERCLTDQADIIRDVVRSDGATAAEKIETFMVALFDYVYDEMANEPRMAELVQHVLAEHRDMVRAHKMEVTAGLVAEILVEGNASGEFDVANVMQTARAVVLGGFAFHTPFLITSGIFGREEMETMARHTARLLVNGLKSR